MPLLSLKKQSVEIGEVERLYVRPAFRGKGIGKKLVIKILAEALEIGYKTIRLDSAKYMVEAHDLYRSFGFQDTEPYTESEIPPEFHQHWVFMEKHL
ncbi:MAG: GNAT family N-acetyltransferase [Candidatus Aminicenantes bacterium]|nr:MAG: GNAT family N-acetyltransferase [Candidatus Aminicenantes bacterium]